jgi:ribosome-binding factor A
LTFVADALPESARTIDDLLAVAAAADAEVHRQAAGAQYAGDADPYRQLRREEDELARLTEPIEPVDRRDHRHPAEDDEDAEES